MNATNVTKITEFARQMIYNANKTFSALATYEDRSRSDRPHTAITPVNVKKVRCGVHRIPQQSMNKLAKDVGISR